MKKAVLFGASGFIGGYLLEELLADPDYARVTVVTRRNLGFEHAKLRCIIGDLESLNSIKSELAADEIFIALGTTKKNTPNPKEYFKIDHDYPVLAAKLAYEHGAQSVFLVSAVGADPDSRFFYVRTKGEVERDIIALGFKHTHLFRPSMLLGQRKEHRSLEKLFISIFKFADLVLVGPLSRYHGIEGRDLARAMVASAKKQSHKIKIYNWKEMHESLTGTQN